MTERNAATGTMADLERLAALRERGVLTEDEFAAKRKQILGLLRDELSAQPPSATPTSTPAPVQLGRASPRTPLWIVGAIAIAGLALWAVIAGVSSTTRTVQQVASTSSTTGCMYSDIIRRCESSTARGWSSEDETRFQNWVIGCAGGDRSATCRSGPGHSPTVAYCAVSLIERQYASADLFFFRINNDERLNTMTAATLTCEQGR